MRSSKVRKRNSTLWKTIMRVEGGALQEFWSICHFSSGHHKGLDWPRLLFHIAHAEKRGHACNLSSGHHNKCACCQQGCFGHQCNACLFFIFIIIIFLRMQNMPSIYIYLLVTSLSMHSLSCTSYRTPL